MVRELQRQPAPQRSNVAAARAARPRKRIAATIRRVAREDRPILKALAAFDRGERPAA